MDKTEKLPGGATVEQLKDWKEKYGEVFLVSVTDRSGKLIEGIFRKPNMAEFSKAVKFLSPDPSDPTPKDPTDNDGNPLLGEDGKPVKASGFPRDMMRAGTIYYLACRLAVDPEMDKDEEVKAGVCIQLVKQFKPIEATIKNL
jgi:hypothetical protein